MKFLKHLFQRKPRVERTDLTRRFDLIGRVGQGSMSKVWRARDTLSGRLVALKVLDRIKTKRYEQRFVGMGKPTEGEVAIQLRHPHIVRTFDIGLSTDDEQFLVMEFVEGMGLSYLVDVQNEVMQQNRLRFMIELGSALEYFHKQNFIHRDICPRNVLLGTENSVKLIDFGLVVPNTPPFQAPGNRTGTANYMAPELIKRQRTDQRIDIYSYAVTCYEMYTRKFPWEIGGESLEAAMQHINRPPRDIREYVPDIDEALAEAIMKGLAADPRDRWSKAGELLAVFRDAQARLHPEQVAQKTSPARQSVVS